MQISKLNVYNNVKQPTVKDLTTIGEWLNLIKDSQYAELITSARNGEADYNEVKTSLPAITYNFTFHTKKANANIVSGTGLMYIDIDTPEFNITGLDTSKVYAYYKSFGGNGYSILVRVEGLTLDNYKPTLTSIVTELGLSDYYDKGAAKATQYNVLSYDESIYINYDSYIFSSTQKNSPHSTVNKKESTYTEDWGEKFIRYNNLDDLGVQGNYGVNWDGWEVIECVIPFSTKIPEGNRNNYLLAYTTNLLYLNPWLPIRKMYSVMKNVNNLACAVPVPDVQVIGVVNSIYKSMEAGGLRPMVSPKKRKIVYPSNSSFSTEEKQLKTLELMAVKKRNDSKEKLYSIIEGWDFDKYGKITQPAIYNNFNISSKTVEKYWKEFKTYIADLNNHI